MVVPLKVKPACMSIVPVSVNSQLSVRGEFYNSSSITRICICLSSTSLGYNGLGYICNFNIDGIDLIVSQLVIFSWDSDEDIAQLSGERCERVLCVAPQLSVSTYLQSCTFR